MQAYAYTTGTVSGTPVTTSFGYSADKLTSFGGTIAYNTMGCPTSYDGKTATWSKGRLARLAKGTLADGTESYLYSYNAYGQRVSKSYSYLEGTSGLNPVVSGQLTGNLDPKNRDIIMNLLRHEHEKGRGIILITHDMDVAKQADTVCLLENGKLTE